MFGGDSVWYVAYGSNIAGERFAQYLSTEPDDPRVSGANNRWITIDHLLYFAGESKTWGGSVAFLSLRPAVGASTPGYARLIEEEDLELIARRENGAADDRPLLLRGGLRPPDIDGKPAVTLTTARLLSLGQPTSEYRAVIETATGRPVQHSDAEQAGSRTNRAEEVLKRAASFFGAELDRHYRK